MPYLGVSPLLFHFSESFFIASLEVLKNYELWWNFNTIFFSRSGLIAALHLFPPPRSNADFRKGFWLLASVVLPLISGVSRSTNSPRQTSCLFSRPIVARQIISDNRAAHSRSAQNQYDSQPSRPINNNLDNLSLFQFTAINQFPANRHQQETNCSRRTKRRFEVGVERQIPQVNIIIFHFLFRGI